MLHRARQLQERLAAGPDYADYGLVFATGIGTALGERNVTRAFKAALGRAGLRDDIRVHDLRHFAATLLFAAGVHPKVASERLGHSTVGLTLDLYTHSVQRLDVDAPDRMSGSAAGCSEPIVPPAWARWVSVSVCDWKKG